MRQDITELAFDPTIPVWRGPDDLSVEAHVTHDGENVIFRFDVTDDKHMQAGHPDAEVWRSDSVQVAFYNPLATAQTLIDLALTQDNRAIVWCYRNTANRSLENRALTQAEAPRLIRREGNRTRYEVRIPFAMSGLPSAKPLPKEGIPVRFTFLVNEDDGHGRVRWIRWRGGLGDNQDITPLGHAILK
ncbi:MAG: hypothetical protein LBK99_25240 [Opitutaceae bacterium]|nr:hypothetical protein [Opitutaceae bacterium]